MNTPTIQTAMDLHRQGRLDEAETHYRGIIANSPGQFEALHCFGILKLQQGKLPEALGLIAKAVELNPSSLDARSNLAAVLLNLGRHADCITECDRILAVRPAELSAHYHRGVAFGQLGRHGEALASFDQALAIKPDHVNALSSRAGSLAAIGRHEEAIAAFDRLLTLVPRHPDALNNRGTILAHLLRHGEALASFEGALALVPDHVNALTNRGIALKNLLRYGEALASFDRAIAVKPDHVEAHVNRANVLLELSHTDDALASAVRALALAPDHPDALTSQAFCLHALGRYQAALVICDQALAHSPNVANAHLIRGHTLAKLNRPHEAGASYEAALAIEPSHPYAFGASLMAYRTACDWQRIDAVLPTMAHAIDDGALVIPPFNLLGLPLEPDRQRHCARNFMRHQAPAALLDRPPPPLRMPDGKIRLAYLSCDFRRHPVSYLVADLLERHDRSRFEVFGLSYGMDDASDERRRIVNAVDQFHDLHSSDDGAAAALIERLQVDIVVDLAGHTENSRPGILSAHSVPVQVNYLGYTGTIGAGNIDYVIGDKIALPFELAPYFAEKIVHLPDCFLVNDAKKAISPVMPTRAAAGLPENGFVFCCFNNSYKISASVFGAWMRLLAAIEGSVLWLSQMNTRATENLQAAAGAAGIDPARIVFAQRVPSMADHLARQRLADLFLDTTDYNAHTTASDALWAGLPVLTCLGRAFPGRVAASLVNAADVPELVVESLSDYEAMAVTLARDPAQLKAIRQRLEARRLTCALFDTDRFRRHIEMAYATMVDIARRGERPRSFTVEPLNA